MLVTAPKLTLKQLKVSSTRNAERIGFNATVCVDGRPVCRARNAGKGGATRYLPLGDTTEAGHDVDEAIRFVGGRLDPRAVDSFSEAVTANLRQGTSIEALSEEEDWSEAFEAGRVTRTKADVFDAAVARLVAEGALIQELKALLGERVLYLHRQRDGLFKSQPAESRAVLARWLADPKLNDKLHARTILNRLPFAEALEIYRRVGRD